MSVNFLEPRYPFRDAYRKKMIKIIFLSLVIGGLLFSGAVWAGAQIFTRRNAPVSVQKLEPIDTKTFTGRIKSFFNQTNTRLAGYDDDRINIALFGIGGSGHEGSQLTDTILVASIKPSTKQVAMISIPRDTMVEIPGMGFRKINEANAYAELDEPGTGTERATEVVEKFLGLEIPYYVRIDFRGFEQVVDDLGGVDVYVEKYFVDNQFPTWDYKVRSIVFAKGWQHLNGARALEYARSRHGNNFEGSDFARARRQQKLILAVRDKVLSADTLLHPTRVTNILNTLDEHIQMNIPFTNVVDFMQLAKDLQTDKIVNIVFSDDPSSVLYASTSTGQFFLRPRDPSLKQIHNVAQNIFDPAVADSVRGIIDWEPLEPAKPKNGKIEIQNGTWRPGFASRQKKRLEADKYKIVAIGNSAARPVARAQIYDVTNKYPEIFEELKKRYSADVVTTRPAISPDADGGIAAPVDIIVILGENVPDIAE